MLDLTPEAADQIGASFREPMRVVLEIGTEEIPDGGPTWDELCRELAKAHYKAEEARREVESLSRRLEFRPEAFDPEKHITKATVAKWLEQEAVEYMACGYGGFSDDTRAIIHRIKTTKETP